MGKIKFLTLDFADFPSYLRNPIVEIWIVNGVSRQALYDAQIVRDFFIIVISLSPTFVLEPAEQALG
ncbi:hypothetical protein [uncultured Alloprevotella sp.]|uniref:hypothetical protein n=1 Tax=uncultured Alloprevotella sp. TaxID=1283315 RepID=UPI0026150BB0|nr:hypothetical protein [uncultured Alloprevotella sp.]